MKYFGSAHLITVFALRALELDSSKLLEPHRGHTSGRAEALKAL